MSRSKQPGCTRHFSAENPTPRYTGLPTFFRAPWVDLNASLESILSEVDIGLIGVPYDGGVTNRPGARFGPRQVRAVSAGNVRRVNQATGVAPFDLGLQVADVGDAHVDHPYELTKAHSEIEEHFRRLGNLGLLLVAVGGDHSVTLPILRALATPDASASPHPMGLIHIDAHADTGDNYGGSRFHHGAPFKVATDEGLIDPKRTIQVGIRGSINHPGMWEFSHTSGMRVVPMEEVTQLGCEGVLAEIKRVVGSGPCYVSFDIDALDPAFAPGTGTPEIGGLTSLEAQTLVRGLADFDIRGADLVEVAPPFDSADITSLAGANLTFELLCVAAQAKLRSKGSA